MPVQVLDYSGGRTLEDLIEYVEDRVAGKPVEDDGEDDSDEEYEEDTDGTDSDTEAEEVEGEGAPKDEL